MSIERIEPTISEVKGACSHQPRKPGSLYLSWYAVAREGIKTLACSHQPRQQGSWLVRLCSDDKDGGGHTNVPDKRI